MRQKKQEFTLTQLSPKHKNRSAIQQVLINSFRNWSGCVPKKYSTAIITCSTVSILTILNKDLWECVTCWQHYQVWHKILQESRIFSCFLIKKLDFMSWKFSFMDKSSISPSMMPFLVVSPQNPHYSQNPMVTNCGCVWYKRHGQNASVITWKQSQWHPTISCKTWQCVRVSVYGSKTEHKRQKTSTCIVERVTLWFSHQWLKKRLKVLLTIMHTRYWMFMIMIRRIFTRSVTHGVSSSGKDSTMRVHPFGLSSWRLK